VSRPGDVSRVFFAKVARRRRHSRDPLSRSDIPIRGAQHSATANERRFSLLVSWARVLPRPRVPSTTEEATMCKWVAATEFARPGRLPPRFLARDSGPDGTVAARSVSSFEPASPASAFFTVPRFRAQHY
jgi:hypothetical protein